MLVQINNQWQSLNALSGIPHTNKIALQSHSPSRVYLSQGDTAPANNTDGAMVEAEQWYLLTNKPTWIRVDDVAGSVYVEVQ